MALENLKFSEAEFSGKDISSLPDRPSDAGITAEELKKRFDQIGKFMIALGRFNELIDALISTTKGDSGAENIKSAPIYGLSGSNVYEMLVELSEKASSIPVPTKLSELENDADFVDKDYVDQLALEAGSVSSVNGKGGAVDLDAADVNAIPAENNAVKADYISNNSITTEKLADRAVTAEKLAPDAVTADGIGAMSKAGDTMTGTLAIKTPNGDAHGRIYKNVQVDGTDYGMYMLDSTNAGTDGFLAMRVLAKTGQLLLADASGSKEIFSQKNKPNGSYTGNGSSAQRTINIGGFSHAGNVLAISMNEYWGFAFYNGGFFYNTNDEKVYVLSSSQVKFQKGILTLATSNASVNYNGSVYYYQVL